MWKDNVAFYLDCVSFWYKRNPADQASAPHGRILHKKCEDGMRGCTLKEGGGGVGGGKVESGGKVVKVIVPISYGKGAVVCHQWHVLKPETPKRNRRNETAGTKPPEPPEPPKPPEQPERNHRNHRNNQNETTGNTVKRSHISSAGSFRRHNFNSSPLPGDKR